ncbi:MAG: sigma 54-interacting transcriptional regulator [Myxococcota bacterium]
MEIRLELANAGKPVLIRELDERLLLIGSNPECHLCIPDESIASIQCLLRKEGVALFLANRSAEGTQVGTETVMDELRLAEGDVIRLGEIEAKVCFIDRGDESVGAMTKTLVQGDKQVATYQLVLEGESWPVDIKGVVLGKAESNDVVIADPYASGTHARVILEEGRVMVEDLDSRNGVFVDGAKIGVGEARDGSVIRVGTTELRLERLDGESARISQEQQAVLSAWVGRSPVSKRVRTLVSRLAQNAAPVLITGETGTGKEVTASILHRAGSRASGPFVALNCGALTPTLIESELFGHEKGAFTGATGRKAGAFESANGGTLFLDEIGELPEALQPQLLRVLETQAVRRVGSSDTVAVDVRVVAATNRDLPTEVEAGRFRADLYHRLAVLGIELPSLRDRRADVADLARHFVAMVAPESEPVTLSSDAIEKLELHTWDGNVRELRNVIQRAVLMRAADVIGPDDISFSLSSLGNVVSARSQLSSRRLSDVERAAIIDALVHTKGNRTEAAKVLGISRSTLHRKLDEYSIEPAAHVREGGD